LRRLREKEEFELNHLLEEARHTKKLIEILRRGSVSPDDVAETQR
jgi:hypothetical protein